MAFHGKSKSNHRERTYIQRKISTNYEGISIEKTREGIRLQGEKFDMEVTAERAEYMKKLLVRLYAHQIGAEVKHIMVRPVHSKERIKRNDRIQQSTAEPQKFSER